MLGYFVYLTVQRIYSHGVRDRAHCTKHHKQMDITTLQNAANCSFYLTENKQVWRLFVEAGATLSSYEEWEEDGRAVMSRQDSKEYKASKDAWASAYASLTAGGLVTFLAAPAMPAFLIGLPLTGAGLVSWGFIRMFLK